MMIVQPTKQTSETFLLQQEGKYAEAIQQAHAQLLKAKMNDSVRDMLDAYVDLYYCYFNELLFEEAIQVYEAHQKLYSLTNNPHDEMYHYMMSYMLHDMTKQYDVGIAQLHKAIAIATSLHAHHIVGLANCFIGALYTRKKEFTAAIHYATLGVAYMRTFVTNLPLHSLQCEVCLTQIFISANQLENATPLIEALDQAESLPKHQTIYFQFLFIKLRYLYATQQLEAAQNVRMTLLHIIDTASDYVLAKMLLPTLKQTLIQLQLHDELTFWIDYEHALQFVMTSENTSSLQAFLAQQRHALTQSQQQALLTKSQFFTQAQRIFETAHEPLALALFQINETSFAQENRSYSEFYVMQQTMAQLLAQFPIAPRLSGFFTQNKFALFFEHQQIDCVLQALQQLPKDIQIERLHKQQNVHVYAAYTSNITSRSNSFLEMYHLVEARMYHLVFH